MPTSDTEQPGVGAAIGGVVGGALGLAGGFDLGIAATALIPGAGPILAAGIVGERGQEYRQRMVAGDTVSPRSR